jgi:hypothetical protein
MAIAEKKNLKEMTQEQLQDYANTLEDRLEATYQRNLEYIEKHQTYVKQFDGFMARMEARATEQQSRINEMERAADHKCMETIATLEATVAAQQARIRRLTRKPRPDTVAKSNVKPQSPQWTLVSTVAETHML